MGSQSSADHGGEGLTGLRLTQSLTDLQVEFHEAGARLRQVPAGAHYGQAARLAQRLVTEVDVQKGLNCVVCLVAKDIVGPQRPIDEGQTVCFKQTSVTSSFITSCLDCCTFLLSGITKNIYFLPPPNS